jgi:glyoxylase-like metal-dependent hydrolase (beta-lactamase superfamily II)
MIGVGPVRVNAGMGKARIHAIIDADSFEIPLSRIFPGSALDALGAHAAWLSPDHIDLVSGMLKLGMHSFLVEAGGLRILIDTCIGAHKERPAHPAWHRRPEGAYLAGLAALGLAPDDIDIVLCTHLHADHVGWNTRLENGHWVPTFPRARYAFAEAELAFWEMRRATGVGAPPNHGSYDDSVLPIIRHGLDLRIQPGAEMGPGMTVVALPGHTPHQVGLRLAGNDGGALFCGDAIHSPVQLVAPQWSSAFCDDPRQSEATRRALFDSAASEGTLLLPAHVRGSRAFRVRRDGTAYLPIFP